MAHRKVVGPPLLIQHTRRNQQLWTVARILLLKINSSQLLMHLGMKIGIELMLLLPQVNSLMLELHLLLLLLRKLQLKLLLLGLQELHLEMLLRTPMTLLLLLIHRMRAENRLAKSH